MKYEHGMLVKIGHTRIGRPITVGKFSFKSNDSYYNKENGYIYFCSDNKCYKGRELDDKLGYKYSYCLMIAQLPEWHVTIVHKKKTGVVTCSKCKTEVLL